MMKKTLFLLVAFLLTINLVMGLDIQLEQLEQNNSLAHSGLRILFLDEAKSGMDGYDFPQFPTAPDEYSQIYAVVDGTDLAIDSFPASSLPKTILIEYNVSKKITDNVTFSWIIRNDTGLNYLLKYYGSDSSRSTLTESINMNRFSEYNFSMNDESKKYFTMMIYTTEQGNTNPQNEVTETKTQPETQETEKPAPKGSGGLTTAIIIIIIIMGFVIAITVFVGLLILVKRRRKQNA